MKNILQGLGLCLFLLSVLGSLSTCVAEEEADCRFGHMRCNVTNKCVPLSWKCDGDNDCGQDDQTDEYMCPPKTCADQEFRCGDGTCISIRWHCDGEPDCDDHTDENTTQCAVTSVCKEGEFSCGDGSCIRENWKCDGAADCDNGADEKNCSLTCDSDMFLCKTTQQCISQSWVCDGDTDCIDKTDEVDCNSKDCNEGEFRCADSTRCIDIKWKCDGDYDCPDHSDEGNCTNHSDDDEICSDTDFKCVGGGDCIHQSWKCDGDPDCTDGSDEGDFCNYTCRDDQFKCKNNYCISKTLHCDHSADCLDGSDELNCTVIESCADRGEFDCYGDGTYCIANDKVCDGHNDCQHREDEEAALCKHKNPCSLKTCKQHSHCVNQAKTFSIMDAVCVCDSGFSWHPVEEVCKDINECEEVGLCSQICINTKGGYKCECQPGYILEKHYFCRADGEQSWLYYANRRDIRRIRTDSRYMEIIVEETSNSIALDIDYEKGLMFWTDGALESIQSAYIGGSAVLATDIKNVITNEGLHAFSTDGIAVDWLYKNIYWTDTGSDKIKVSNYAGSKIKTLVSSELDDPRAICLDPENGFMYWSDWGKEPKIERSGMDGSKRKTIVVQGDGLEWPNGLTIDYIGKRIYWIDSKLHTIGSADLEGNDFRRILVNPTEIQRPFSISVFEDSLYWTDWHTNSIRSVNKFTGRDPQTLSLGSYSVMDIKVYHSMRQSKVFAGNATALCGAKQCEQMCLPIPYEATNETIPRVTCACQDGFELKEDARTCKTLAFTVAPSIIPANPTTPAPTPKPTIVPVPEQTTNNQGYTVVPENNTESSVPQNKDQGNGVGLIAITVAGIVVAILVAVFVVAFMVYRRYRARNKKSMNFDNPVYRKTTTTEEQCMISNDDDAMSPQMQPLTSHHENV